MDQVRVKHELSMGNKAADILKNIASEGLLIAYVYTNIKIIPENSCTIWSVEIKTDKGHHLTLQLEGNNVTRCREIIDFDGHRLIGRHNPLTVLSWLEGPEMADLDQVVLTAVTQILPK